MKTRSPLRERLLPICFFGFFLAICLAFFLCGLLGPAAATSHTENRALAPRPALRRVFTDLGGFAQDFESYAQDHFPARETLLRTYTQLERAQGKHYYRSAYVLSDNWLLTPTYRTTAQQRADLQAALQTAAQSAPLAYCVLPTKNAVLYDLDPRYFSADVDAQNKTALLAALQTVDGLTAIDASAPLCTGPLSTRKQYFYQTDFHWNARGAYRASEAIAAELVGSGLLDAAAVPRADAFVWTDLTGRAYQGDLNRRFSNLFSMQEQLPLFTPADCADWVYALHPDQTDSVPRQSIVGSGLADAASLDYNRLFTDNLGYYRVENPHAPDARSVLLLKDSFQNATVDYFCSIFREVNVVDPRFYQEALDYPALVSARGIELVLFFYHQNNLSAELIDFLT